MQWRHWFASYPELDHIQLEVTTFCNAGCSYCPRTTAGNAWKNLHMTPELLIPLLKILPGVPYVHLQGWGEPLLNPRFFELVEIVKQQGCRCGTTTNGVLIDKRNAEKLILSGIDLVAFSLTGAGPSHDVFRQGAPLLEVLGGMRQLAEAKNQSVAKNTPAIHVAYMLLREGMDEIGNIPELLDGLGVNEIVVSTLDHVPHPALEGQVLSRGTPEWEELAARLAEMKKLLAKKGTRLIFDADVAAEIAGSCSERVDRTLIVAADGGIHPCVFSNLPDSMTGRKKKCFGNLREGLDKIWWSEEYRRFRESLGEHKPDGLCLGCSKLPSRR